MHILVVNIIKVFMVKRKKRVCHKYYILFAYLFSITTDKLFIIQTLKQKEIEILFFLSWLFFMFPNFSQYLFIFISFALLIIIILSFLYICCHFLLIIITHYLID